MSSPYVVLGSRSLDKWKVTELKEELKRRRLTTSGLKADLIKRLDEAVRIEWESSNGQTENTFTDVPQFELSSSHQGKNHEEMGGYFENVTDQFNNSLTTEPQYSTIGHYDIVPQPAHENSQVQITDAHGQLPWNNDSSGMYVVPQNESNLQNIETQNLALDTTVELDVDYSAVQSEQEVQPFKYGVPDVGVDLGFELRSDLVSTESFPVSEKNELMVDAINDDVKLDAEAKHDAAQASLCDLFTGGDESRRVAVEESLEQKLPFERIGGENAANVDSHQEIGKGDVDASMEENVLNRGEEEHKSDPKGIKESLVKPLEKEVPLEETGDGNTRNDDDLDKLDAGDLDPPEKLSLEHSSSDDFMDDDATESRQVEQKFNSCNFEVSMEKSSIPTEKEEKFIDVVTVDKFEDLKGLTSENEPVKRKLNADEDVPNKDTGKRQRIYNAGSLKISEKQSGNNLGSLVPSPQPTLKSFSRSDSAVSEEAPKERVVPPSSNPPTNSLRIDHFLRPFTLKAVQEFLGKTGAFTNFWMDHIKTHCYVSYSSVEEAVATRNAVYNLQWPPNGGRFLVAEFVDPQEVKTRVESPQSPATPITTAQQHLQVPTNSFPPPPSLCNQPSLRECTNLSRKPLQDKDQAELAPTASLPEKVESPILTLDDLFRKTKATPRIYYLPLSDEQVANKLKSQGKNNTKQ